MWEIRYAIKRFSLEEEVGGVFSFGMNYQLIRVMEFGGGR